MRIIAMLFLLINTSVSYGQEINFENLLNLYVNNKNYSDKVLIGMGYKLSNGITDTTAIYSSKDNNSILIKSFGLKSQNNYLCYIFKNNLQANKIIDYLNSDSYKILDKKENLFEFTAFNPNIYITAKYITNGQYQGYNFLKIESRQNKGSMYMVGQKGGKTIAKESLPGTKGLIEVDVNPEPPGGIGVFRQWIADNYFYPKEAIDNKVSGTVVASFDVDLDGRLNNIKIIRDIGYGTGQAFINVLKKSPKWKPATIKNKPVVTSFSLPLKLDLSGL
ncbi:energy transducer TonB [Sphingobacterium bovistauri]|uniref:Energy transducer TonB n=1 Tax=Sphingobacterium bovistauri TaxID=2781959 RepID=A0ABS7Z8W4_9SPHI|nr:energy transducer TonB [Sphingobacterium bovistauri]MCA5005305.1 energy transducer TonB [Sphingobacterium bovistauri]